MNRYSVRCLCKTNTSSLTKTHVDPEWNVLVRDHCGNAVHDRRVDAEAVDGLETWAVADHVTLQLVRCNHLSTDVMVGRTG